MKHLIAIVGFGLLTAQVYGQTVNADICVYGGTAGGVAAAVQASRMHKQVVLLEPGQHVGGMTASGLSLTDYGSIEAIGGISLEFYRRVGAKYSYTNTYWASPVIKQWKWYLDPGVAEAVFNEMLAEAKVTVHFNQSLDSVSMTGQRITQLKTTDGLTVRAKMFIDATYEGDLMRDTGVKFTVGREGTNVYGESLAGFLEKSVGNSGVNNVDPYWVPGDATSGLLPLVRAGDGGVSGQGDDHIQAYGFRLCFTKVKTNQIPWDLEKPANYSEANYELLRRYINAWNAKKGQVHLDNLLKLEGGSPGKKVDVNNNGDLVSTDFVGQSDTWATNTYAGRAVIYQAHWDYELGYLYYLATSTNVPVYLRSEMRSWGLAKDEFKDHGGWPYQLYVREARRMISDYVMQQSDGEGKRVADDSIGLASYALDSHLCQRYVLNGGAVREGGMFQPVPRPFPISYRSIVPGTDQCQNLFETFALSASHVAFGSCRMEPVHMIVAQSAATAAVMAIADNVPVQEVNYTKLAERLKADGQLLIYFKSMAKP